VLDIILLGHNESKNLPKVLKSLHNQSIPLFNIIFVDDDSLDGSRQVASKFGAKKIIRLIRGKRSYLLGENLNAALHYLTSPFFMIMPCDVLLEKQYAEKLLQHFSNSNLMIASGSIIGEKADDDLPRGAGRIYRKEFFDKWIRVFPENYVWESYPVYKALSLGFSVKAFKDIKMFPLRPSKGYRSIWGFAMKQLGYSKIYAYTRIFKASLKNPILGAQMFKAFRSPMNVYDQEVAKWLRHSQPASIFKKLRGLMK